MNRCHHAARRQAGISLLGGLILALLVGSLVLFAFRVVPMYLQYYQLRKDLVSLRSNVNDYSVSLASIQRHLQRRFDIDYITAVKPEDLHIYRRQGRILVDVDYRDQRPLIGNLSIVAHFQHQVQLYP